MAPPSKRSDFLDVDIMSLKRKMKDDRDTMAKCLKSSSGNGPRVECLVLKRMPPKDKKAGSKHAPPTSMRVMVTSNDVELEYIGTLDDGDTGPSSMPIPRGSLHWIGIFDASPDVIEGSTIVIQNIKATEWNGKVSLSGGANLLKKPSFDTVATLDRECYELPELGEIDQKGNVLIPVNIDSLNKDFKVFTYGCDNTEAYINKKQNSDEVKLGAYIKDNRGYPFVYMSAASQHKVLVNVKFYDNHLVNFGIVDVETWSKLAPSFFDSMSGVISGYINTKETKGFDCNNTTDSEYDYALSVTCTNLFIDLPKVIKQVGFKVESEYVKDFFRCEPFVESEHSHDNPLFKSKSTSSVINLSEYTGKLDPFLNTEAWELYSVVNVLNYDGDNEHNDLKIIRDQMSYEEREACLKQFFDNNAGGRFEIEFDKEQIYAVKNEVN